MSVIEIKVSDNVDLAEATVIMLLVKVGDTMKAEQSLITVESNKMDGRPRFLREMKYPRYLEVMRDGHEPGYHFSLQRIGGWW